MVSNTGTETEYVYLSNDVPQLPSFLTVVTMSVNSGYKPGFVLVDGYILNFYNGDVVICCFLFFYRDIVPSNPQFPEVFIMRPHSVLVLKTEPESVIM